jgi:hypothetical protein
VQERLQARLLDLRAEAPDVVGVLEHAADRLADDRLVQVIGVQRRQR